MPRISNTLVLFLAVLAGLFRVYVNPVLKKLGHGRLIESVGNNDCTVVPELQACEKVVIHQETGLLYLACSTPAKRAKWVPAMSHMDASGATGDDYVAVYNPESGSVTRLKLDGFSEPRGLSLHGMDVVPSAASPSEAFVYLINHRAPEDRESASKTGADSVVEIFKTTIGSDTLKHVKTIESPVILTPNDVVGYPDGESFYFTNDHAEKTGFLRYLDFFGRSTTSVGFCHANEGCKYAITGLRGSNGITRALNDTIYVADCFDGKVSMLERQSDNSLVVTDVVQTGLGVDNLSIDAEGAVWAAGLPNLWDFFMKQFKEIPEPVASTALRVTINEGINSFYGEKYSIDKVFEDDGIIASGVTTVAYDTERKRLFLHGLASPQLTVCRL